MNVVINYEVYIFNADIIKPYRDLKKDKRPIGFEVIKGDNKFIVDFTKYIESLSELHYQELKNYTEEEKLNLAFACFVEIFNNLEEMYKSKDFLDLYIYFQDFVQDFLYKECVEVEQKKIEQARNEIQKDIEKPKTKQAKEIKIKLYTVKECSKILKLQEATILNYIKENKIIAYKIGNRYRISNEAIKDYLKGLND